MAISGKTRMGDRVGAWAGAACTLHCGLAPVALALLPAGAAWWVGSEPLHLAGLAFLSLLALATTWWSTRRHRRFYAWFAVLPGLALLWTGELAGHWGGGTGALVATVAGGTLIVAGHLLNLRLAHGHVHDACCHHD